MTDQVPDQGKEEQVTESYLEQLVGEGKQYANIEALAKSRIDANEHIQRLEAEAASRREEEDKVQKQEQQLETVIELLKPREEEQVIIEEKKVDPVVVEPTIKEEPSMEIDIKSLRKREAEKLLIEKYGDTQAAGEAMKKYVDEDPDKYGVITTLMCTDPNALINILPDPEVMKEGSLTSGTGMTTLPNTSLPLTRKEADKVLKENPGVYRSEEFQAKLTAAWNAADAAGIKFSET